jgi:hypothetical protein
MTNSGFLSGLWAVVLSAALVIAVTVVQGRMTERWAPASRDEVERVSQLLEERFPQRFGDWEVEQQLDGDPRELARAGAVGHVSVVFFNARSKSRVSAFVVSALPHDASGHTPDRCYPGAGFSVGESEHRRTVPLADGRKAEAFTGTFVKSGQTLRIFWTYGVPSSQKDVQLDWIAPQLARIALDPYPAVYKLYAIVDETRLGATQSMAECEQLIAQLLPAFDASLAADAPAVPAADPPSETDAEAAPPAASAAID